MYFYIYDSFLARKKRAKLVSRIETRLASLDIAGKKYQLSILKSVEEIVGRILQKESPTIVIIGKDTTFYKAALPLAGTGAVLGFIPTEPDSLMADLLGLPVNEYACDIISSRRITEVNLGKINEQKFFSSLEFSAKKSVLTADNSYKIIPKKIKTIKVINLDLLNFQRKKINREDHKIASNPADNYLEILMGTPEKKWLFKSKEKKDSLFFVKTLKVVPQSPDDEILIKVDKNKIIKAPAVIELDKKKIKLIVGKDRLI